MAHFIAKTRTVTAYKLTIDNLETLADWCDGSVKGIKLDPKERVVQFYHVGLQQEYTCEIGQWIIRHDEKDFEVLNEQVFVARYHPA